MKKITMKTLTEDQKKKLKLAGYTIATITGGYLLVKVISPTKLGETIKSKIARTMMESIVRENGYAIEYIVSVNEHIIPTTIFKDIDTFIDSIVMPYINTTAK